MSSITERVRRRSGALVGAATSAVAIAVLTGTAPVPLRRVSRWALWTAAALGVAVAANDLAGKPVPVLRWSVLRIHLGMRHLLTEWQVGDGREEALARYVCTNARPGDVDDAIQVIDDFCRHRSVLMNVGDEKGLILDEAVRGARPRRLLELGAYCGYSALRMARVMPPGARLYSVEFNPANAEIARRIWDHAGVGERVTVVVGTLGDGGSTLRRLCDEHGFTDGGLDFVFLDHDKRAYLHDLERILAAGWLHTGAVVVADNVGFPGVPTYRAYMREREGCGWRTTEHATHAAYQKLIKDVVLVSEYLGY
jgi:predicted O-methyltransferase YrrM